MLKKLLGILFSCCAIVVILFGASSISKAAGDNASAPAEDTGGSASSAPPEEVSTEDLAEAEPMLTLETIRTVSFQDLPETESRADCIRYAACLGLLSGVDENHFDPDSQVTLAAALTSLYRMSGEAAPAYHNAFPDVPEGKWYTDAVAWGVNAGIVAGQSDGMLHPSEPITRVQLAVMLYRFAASADGRTYDEQFSGYSDGGDVPDYACAPMAWALENRLFAGIVYDAIHPHLPVSRAQLAQALVALTAYCTEEPVAMALTTQLNAKIAVSSSQANHEDIQLLIDNVASKYGAIGLQVAVVEDGRVTDAYTYGYARKNTTPMTPEHKIRAASLSKVAVGMAAMLLREQGTIALDQDISSYWGVRIQNPKYPNNPITIRNLLSHTSSIRAFASVSSYSYSAVKSQLTSSSCFTSGTPGSIRYWSYNNYAFAVLGMTLELASGKYLDSVMDAGLWDIMDIDAAFESGCIKNTDLLADLYYHDGGVSRSAAVQATYKPKDTPGGTGGYFAGGLTISAVDMAKMAALLANDGYYEGLRLISLESVELMETRNETILSDGTYQALPLRCQDQLYGRDRIYYHTGSAYGVYNLFSYDPAGKDGVVVLTVGASGAKDSRNIYAVCSEICEYIYKVIE